MPLLSKLLDLSCTLIDYEKITDENDRRLVFFGNYAGLAGMIDTLWAFGKRLAWEGTPNPFEEIKCALDYPDLAAAKEAIARAGDIIAKKRITCCNCSASCRNHRLRKCFSWCAGNP